MSEAIIEGRKLSGSVTVPPSKSISHRMIIAAGLSKGTSVVKNVSFSEDILATIGAMRALGAQIEMLEDSVKICGISEKKSFDNIEIFCNESGSTLRFMIPIALSFGGTFTFTGSSRLLARPLDAYFEICKQDGISYKAYDDKIVFSGRLKGGKYSLRGDVSSQYITGLLFALAQLGAESEIAITTELESAGYVDLTLDALEKFGIMLKREGNTITIPQNLSFKNADVTVEGDYSQAAFYLVANALGSNVKINGLNRESCQGDREIVDVIDRLKNGGTTIDVRQIPDLVPIITVLATQTEGTTHIINAGRLRIKESDRLFAITKELKKMGADITEEPDGLIIRGKTEMTGTEVYAHNDHRIAMSLAICATVCRGKTVISDSECVKKSYGNFWTDYFSL